MLDIVEIIKFIYYLSFLVLDDIKPCFIQMEKVKENTDNFWSKYYDYYKLN